MAGGDPDSLKQFLVGGDISALSVIEKYGGIFRDQGKSDDAIKIMTRYGSNCFRLRLFVDPTRRNVVVNDLPYTIALAQRIKAAGAKLLLNFHYSDTWADPAHQNKPKAWQNLAFAKLENKVFEYSRDCIAEFKKANVMPDFIQPGNEITPGMLWPDGKLYGLGEPEQQWGKFTRLLKAGIRGIKTASPEKPPRIVIHIDCGGDWSKTKWFFQHIEKHIVPYDIIGLSYYPWWHGSLADLKTNLQNCAATFKKDIFVVETAYPYKPMKIPQKNAEKSMAYSMTPQGQKDFLSDLIRTVKAIPDRRGIGVLWWYPESIPAANLRIWNAGKTALFDQTGNPLPALKQLTGNGKLLIDMNPLSLYKYLLLEMNTRC